MKTSRFLTMIWLALSLILGGCDHAISYRALPAPRPETPSVNPPVAIRQSNWLKNNEGSCVHASLSSMLHWANQFDLAKQWRQTYGGGEYSDRLRRRLDAAGIKYFFTESSSLDMLDYAHSTRRGALLWWKPSHCCMFCGWVRSADNVTTYAVILDNNSVQKYELVERGQFHRLWAGYGGFALTTLFDPPSPPIYRSYEPTSMR